MWQLQDAPTVPGVDKKNTWYSLMQDAFFPPEIIPSKQLEHKVNLIVTSNSPLCWQMLLASFGKKSYRPFRQHFRDEGLFKRRQKMTTIAYITRLEVSTIQIICKWCYDDVFMLSKTWIPLQFLLSVIWRRKNSKRTSRALCKFPTLAVSHGFLMGQKYRFWMYPNVWASCRFKPEKQLRLLKRKLRSNRFSWSNWVIQPVLVQIKWGATRFRPRGTFPDRNEMFMMTQTTWNRHLRESLRHHSPVFLRLMTDVAEQMEVGSCCCMNRFWCFLKCVFLVSWAVFKMAVLRLNVWFALLSDRKTGFNMFKVILLLQVYFLLTWESARYCYESRRSEETRMANFMTIFWTERICPVIPGPSMVISVISMEFHGISILICPSLAIFQTLETWQEQREAGWGVGNHGWNVEIPVWSWRKEFPETLGCSRSTAGVYCGRIVRLKKVFLQVELGVLNAMNA